MKSREVDEAVEVLLHVLNLLKFWFYDNSYGRKYIDQPNIKTTDR